MPWTLDQEAPLSSASVTAITDKSRPFRLEGYQKKKSLHWLTACTFPISHSSEFSCINEDATDS